MIGGTGIHNRVDVGSDDGERNRLRLELPAEAEGESIVLAYRCEGELVELAERQSPAVAVIRGDLE